MATPPKTIPPTLAAAQQQGFDANDRGRIHRATRGNRNIPVGEFKFYGFDGDDEVDFTFIINPAQLKRSRKKVGQYILTKFGYERQNWGNDLTIFEYSGATGVFRPGDGFPPIDTPSFDIRATSAYLKFREFEEFYENTGNDQNMVRMQYWGYATASFIGSIDDFQFTYDVMKEPFVIRYSFKYTAIPERLPRVETELVGTRVGDPDYESARSNTVAV